MENNNHQLSRMESNIETIQATVERIDKILTGNGDPSKGLIVRFDRLEQGHQRTKWLTKATISTCIGIIVASLWNWFKHL